MSQEKARCLWCDREGTHLCDFVLGRNADKLTDPGAPPGVDKIYPEGRTPGTLMHIEDEYMTCDAPMCGEHKRTFGFVCFRGKDGCDTMDHCPVHHREESSPDAVVSESQVEAYRRGMAMLIRAGVEVDHATLVERVNMKWVSGRNSLGS